MHNQITSGWQSKWERQKDKETNGLIAELPTYMVTGVHNQPFGKKNALLMFKFPTFGHHFCLYKQVFFTNLCLQSLYKKNQSAMKMFSSKWLFSAIIALLVITIIGSCQKTEVNPSDEPLPNQNKLSVYLTDGPGYFDSILVNIQGLAVKIDTTEEWWGWSNGFHNWWNNWGNQDKKDRGAFWDTLKINPGIYNLLDLANGADTLLASANVAKGKILAFKLSLGSSGNSLVKSGTTYPLNLVPGWNNVFIRVYGDNFQKVNSNHYKIWIDFDAGRSIIKVHDGLFYLRPYLRAFAVSNTGAVTGTVKPNDAFPVISVGNDSDTLYSIPGKNGVFMVKGLPEGSYDVFINTSNGYKDTTITNVSVEAGKTVQLGNIKLHK